MGFRISALDVEIPIDLIEAYGIKAIISGDAEAWMLAEDVAAQGISVFLEPAGDLPGNFDNINARRKAANKLVKAGVKVAFADS